jgi:hypothetical protein
MLFACKTIILVKNFLGRQWRPRNSEIILDKITFFLGWHKKDLF